LLDRTRALQQPWLPELLTASLGQQREWAFLAWWGLGDVAKHATRGSSWRALRSLQEVRDLVWKLHAAALGVDCPHFGPVSVENAGLGAPAAIEASLPSGADPGEILRAAAALVQVLDQVAGPLAFPGLRAIVLERLSG
jgi:hypothetical protein